MLLGYYLNVNTLKGVFLLNLVRVSQSLKLDCEKGEMIDYAVGCCRERQLS